MVPPTACSACSIGSRGTPTLANAAPGTYLTNVAPNHPLTIDNYTSTTVPVTADNGVNRVALLIKYSQPIQRQQPS